MPSTALLAVSVAAVFYVGGLNSFPLLLALLGLVILLAYSLSKLRASPETLPLWALGPADAICLALLLCTLASPLYSSLPAVSVEVGLVIASLPLSYLTGRLLNASGNPWGSIFAPLLPAAVLVVAIAIPEFLAQHQRPFSTFGDSNALAGFFNALYFPMYIRVLAGWISGSRPPNLPWMLAWLAVLLIAIAFSTSLGGQLCFLGGLALTALLAGISRAKTWKALGAVIIFFAPVYIFANHYAEGREVTSRFADLESQSPFTERIEMSRSALAFYAEGPWYGTGIGTYKMLYPAHRSVREISTTGDLAHNDYVQFLAEGGPVLLGCLLALAALTGLRLWQSFKNQSLANGDDISGYAVALACLLVHAVMNFIFYVLPLSMLAGLYIARTESARSSTHMRTLGPFWVSKLPTMFLSAFVIFVLGTVGIRSLFVGLMTGDCGLRICNELRSQTKPVVSLANILIATQPTWVPSRIYLIDRLRQEAMETQDLNRQMELRTLAAKEVFRIIDESPAVFFSYSKLALMIEETPKLKALVPASIPNEPTELYRLALARRPQDQGIRLALAKTLERRGLKREAFDLVNEDGMRWWRIALIPDSDRVEMLRYMIPRAIAFGLCEDARGMAGSLGLFIPSSSLARAVSSKIKKGQSNLSDCGISGPLPEQ